MEVEVRAKLESLDDIKSKFESLGASFGEQRKQTDMIFKKKGEEKKEQGPGDYILRIRESNRKILTFKALTEVTGAWEEYQVTIDSIDQMEKMLKRMGFVNSLTMKKTRISAKLDDFEVCLDDVEGLGPHMEIELESDNKEEAKKRILKLMNKLGIDESNVEHKGYVQMLYEKQGVVFKGTG